MSANHPAVAAVSNKRNRARSSAGRLGVPASMLLAAAMLASCSSTDTTHISTESAAIQGHLSGVTYVRGSVVKAKPAEANVTATLKSDGGKSYSTRTASDGSLTFELPAGTYELSARLTKQYVGNLATPEEVVVTTNGTTNVKLYANLP